MILNIWYFHADSFPVFHPHHQVQLVLVSLTERFAWHLHHGGTPRHPPCEMHQISLHWPLFWVSAILMYSQLMRERSHREPIKPYMVCSACNYFILSMFVCFLSNFDNVLIHLKGLATWTSPRWQWTVWLTGPGHLTTSTQCSPHSSWTTCQRSYVVYEFKQVSKVICYLWI